MGLFDSPPNPTQGLDPRYQAIADAIDDPMVRAAFIAQASRALPQTKELLGAAGKVPILGDVLGTGIDILGTLSAARHGALGREKMARAIGGSLAFEGLPDAAQVASSLQTIRTGRSMQGVHEAQQDSVRAGTENERRVTDATLEVKNAEKHLRDAQGQTEQMRAYERFTAAQENLARATAALRYEGQLPEGFTPTPETVKQVGGRTFAQVPGGPAIDLGQAPKPPGAGAPPPMGAFDEAGAKQYVQNLPPDQQPGAQIIPLQGRPGLFRVEKGQVPDATKKAEAIKQLRESAPSYTLWGRPRGGTNWRADALMRERGQQLLNLATGRPIPIDTVLSDDGQLDMQKLERVMSQGQIYQNMMGW